MSSKVQSLLHTNSPSRYQIVLLISVVTGSWAAIFARIAQHENVPTIVIVAFRLTVGALVLTPFVMRRYRDQLYRLRRKDILFTAFAGFWFAIHLTSGFASLEHTSVLVSSVVGGTIPLWIALLEVFFLKARLNQTMWLGLGVTLVGGIIIALAGSHDTSLGNNPMLGSLLSLMAAGAGAVYAIGGVLALCMDGFWVRRYHGMYYCADCPRTRSGLQR
jgi:drug/metabolite transporter (DMT)-like permease